MNAGEHSLLFLSYMQQYRKKTPRNQKTNQLIAENNISNVSFHRTSNYSLTEVAKLSNPVKCPISFYQNLLEILGTFSADFSSIGLGNW